MIPNDYIPGVDISSIQGKLDFTQLAKAYQFVICRCFVGNDFKDLLYQSNVAAALDAGMKVATYHFAYPLPNATGKLNHDPKEQATLHFAASGSATSLVVCDLEWPYPQNWKQWACSASQVKDWARAYLAQYEALSGQRPAIYTYPSFAQALSLEADFADYALWIASYTQTPHIPAPWTDWAIWQNAGGSVTFNGVKIDTNFAKDLTIFGA